MIFISKTYWFLLFIFLTITIIFFPGKIYAYTQDCGDRYLTLINPVRGRAFWRDQSLKPISDQYNLISQYNFSATWLVQFDALQDKELVEYIKSFNDSQDMGLFLEISPNLAEKARVIYQYDAAWSEPQAIFLSGYSQSERIRLIDTLVKDFRENLGYYPKAVGAWWIDSYSINYLKEKYDIKAALIVADQKSTDRYGVWGQWWGYPYYPSKANILTPADNLKDKQDIVILQWAQRDLSSAYGDGPKYSNYSLQANDYTSLGQDTQYFEKLTNVYLDCKNPIGQITVGLETGIESVGNLDEYKKQLLILRSMKNLKSVSMSEFAFKFAEVYPQFPKEITLEDDNSVWNLNTKFRSNGKLNDLVTYKQTTSFKDYFVADKSKFLNRKLDGAMINESDFFMKWFIFAVIILGIFSYYRRKFKVFIISTLFAVASFGLVLKSYNEFGWKIFFGSAVGHLALTQILLIILSFLVILILARWRKVNLWLVPLSFAFDPIIQALRFSIISGQYLLGFAVDNLRFVGVAFGRPFHLGFVNQDLPAYQAAALLRIDYNKIWSHPLLSLFIYPVIHLGLAIVLWYFLNRLPQKTRNFLILLLSLLFAWHLANIFQADPRVVTPDF